MTLSDWILLQTNKILFHFLGLQLQRNEVIALMNLLNRLSESVKFVHEVGPSVETTMEGQIAAPATEGCPLHRMWASIFNS